MRNIILIQVGSYRQAWVWSFHIIVGASTGSNKEMYNVYTAQFIGCNNQF